MHKGIYKLYVDLIKYQRMIMMTFMVALFSFVLATPTYAGNVVGGNRNNASQSSTSQSSTSQTGTSGLSQEEQEERLNSRPDEPSLSKIYQGNMMRGTWRWIERFSFFGKANNVIVSFIGLASNCSLLFRQAVTIFYLSNRALWDRVHDIHDSKGQGGYGIDALLERIMAIVPDLKEWSDWNTRSGIKLSDDDDVWTFIIKSAPSSIGLLLISTMAYNGTLGRVWSNCADGLGSVFEVFTTINLGDKIQNMITKEQGYAFTYEDGSYYGKFKQKVAKTIYAKVSSEAQLHDTVQFNKLGEAIEQWITTNIDGNQYGLDFDTKGNEFDSKSEDGYNYAVRDKNEHAYEDYKISVAVNSKASAVKVQKLDGSGEANVTGFRLKDYNPSLNEDFDQYVHIIIKKQ